MKPKPLSSLNHFTVPVAIYSSSDSLHRTASPGLIRIPTVASDQADSGRSGSAATLDAHFQPVRERSRQRDLPIVTAAAGDSYAPGCSGTPSRLFDVDRFQQAFLIVRFPAIAVGQRAEQHPFARFVDFDRRRLRQAAVEDPRRVER